MIDWSQFANAQIQRVNLTDKELGDLEQYALKVGKVVEVEIEDGEIVEEYEYNRAGQKIQTFPKS